MSHDDPAGPRLVAPTASLHASWLTTRRRGLATWALGLHAARGLGPERVLITCDPDNEASAPTIDANGDQLEDVRATSIGPKRRCWITLTPTPS